jgi:peptidoglycan/xylan/chitin deacetylase (PgdA/CDA1 family)
LDQEGVKATFFVLARNLDPTYSRHHAKNQHTLREIVKRGHLFGSHSYNHPNFVNAGNWNVENDMRKADDIFNDILGFKPRLMRPPEG